MWKIMRPILGLLLILAVPYGVYDMVTKDYSNGRDTEAVGTIDFVTKNSTRFLGVKELTPYYDVTYSFRTHEGDKYSNSHTISYEVYTSLRVGQKLQVMYHSNNPRINHAPAFSEYTTVAETVEMSPTSNPLIRGVGLFLFFGLGVYLTWVSFSQFLPQSSGSARPGANFTPRLNSGGSNPGVPADRIAAFGSRK